MNKKIFIGCLLFCLCNGAWAEGSENVSALVKTVALQQMQLVRQINGYGTVVPEPGATVNLNFPKGGRVERLLVSPGQYVAKGAALLEITTDPNGTLAYGQAVNAVTFARGELERTQSLFSQQLVTRSQVDAAAKALKDAEQALATQRALGGGVRQDKLLAPFDGLVASLSVGQGDRFQVGANLAQLARTDYLRAKIGVEPEDSRQIRPGMKVRVVSVFDPNHEVDGEVRQVSGQIDSQTQLVDITVRFKGDAFLPGTRVRGYVAAESHNALAVPRQAVLSDQGGPYLFQVISGHAYRIKVEIGVEDGNWLEVRSHSLKKAPVVVLGNYELTDGMAVRESKQ